ncbi:MAG: type I restriction-modification system subunit M N-terminal domain-containing protein, partial [Phascolarctobacterium sp.]|nr:type I restriction-modification system subunit M N-terminal domain-containing protein [Phascolarctobacterium sp.]
MSTSDIQKTQQAALHATLWNMANDLRGAMEAYEFKSYILGLIFFRYLSEKVEKQAAEFLQYDNISFEDFWKDADDEIKQSFREEMIDALGYFIEPEHLFSSLIAQIQTNDFDIEVLQKAITSISESSLGTESQQDFEGLFDDMDLTNNKLGKDVKSRSKVMGKAMTSINSLSLEFDNAEIDVLGDAYEYLIGMFAQT